ncbi:MAG: hypothetical protein ACC652_13960 [Acidimicrobiales bacterium]
MGVVANQVLTPAGFHGVATEGLGQHENPPLSSEQADVLVAVASKYERTSSVQQSQLKRLATVLPLPTTSLPAIPKASLSPSDVAELATNDLEQILRVTK